MFHTYPYIQIHSSTLIILAAFVPRPFASLASPQVKSKSLIYVYESCYTFQITFS